MLKSKGNTFPDSTQTPSCDVYISTAGIQAPTLKEAILQLVGSGVFHIELSGTHYTPNVENLLLKLQDKWNIHFLCHHYFPIPEKPFTLNLASLDNCIIDRSIKLCQKALRLSQQLGAKKYGIHAGYCLDIPCHELGKPLSKSHLKEKKKYQESFISHFCRLKSWQETHTQDVELYIENNVLSQKNHQTFSLQNPLMLTHQEEYIELKKRIPFKLLLDWAHLKVSCKTLRKNFSKQLNFLNQESDYIHISDNDATKDQNKPIDPTQSIAKHMLASKLKGKTITLEIYDSLEKILNSYEFVSKIVSNRL